MRRNRQHDEHDQSHARDAVRFETIGRGANRVTSVVARAVGNNAWVAGIVFIDIEDDFHQVGADIGDFRENTAGDAKGGCAERFTDREPDEARARVVARNEQQNRQHDRELNANQQRADADAGLQRNRINREGLAAQARKRRSRIRVSVNADAEPRHAITARDANQAECHDCRDAIGRHFFSANRNKLPSLRR